ncbi:MAG TPA: M6 family metalloprotease domain-containing protein [Elusimicrobiota bacterium]|nr:M6 family metalloprotease domain-containing protein [Elusimicrobiota bacterium]
MRKRLAPMLALSLSLSNSTWAVKHIDPNAYPHPFQDQIHHPSASQVRAFGSVHAASIASAVGDKYVAVIIVQFTGSSGGLTTGSPLIQSVANIQTYFNLMHDYYLEASYGKLILHFSYFNADNSASNGDASPSPGQTGVYTLPHPMEYYGCGDEGSGCNGVATPSFPAVNANGDYLIADALAAARAGHGDTPGNKATSQGNFDSVVVVHAGNGNETTRANGDIWSIFYSQDSTISAAGGGFDEGDVVPETESAGITSPMGVMCHEFGHELGLPDEYNTTALGGSSVVGNWELMDSGPFDGNGANPSHPGAWDKVTLGWATPQLIVNKGTNSISFVEKNATGMLKLPVQNGGSEEYFLAEYRSRSSGATYDRNIPGDGLLIWHIDDSITSARGINAANQSIANTVNTGSPHYGISIVPKDGLSISNSNQGDSGNPFSNGDNFTHPKSDSFGGQPSGINILAIAGVGTSAMTTDVENLQVGPTQSILKLTNYPNPAGMGYPHPLGEGHTTIQVQLATPPNSLDLNIYTLSGDLVRKISQTEIHHNTRDADANFKFEYEYDWDLKNDDGRLVAPGVYLYLIRVDGQSQTGKAVIIR